MKTSDARIIADRISEFLRVGEYIEAEKEILPVLQTKTAFRLLDIIGEKIGAEISESNPHFIYKLASERTMGGWVVIASALRVLFKNNPVYAIKQTRLYTIQADTWYGTDIFGERVPGPALLSGFDETLNLIRPWRVDPNRWVRRMTGVAIHYWAKQAHGREIYAMQVTNLLEFIEPMYGEKNVDAVKGIGWGLKTLGKYYPYEVSEWLMIQNKKPHSALMQRKAMKYLPVDLREKCMGTAS